jgi:TonB family protein
VKDSVNAVLLERAELERGFAGSAIASGLAHALVVGIAVGVTLLSPREPLMKVAVGFAMPMGGYGTPKAAAAAPAPPTPVTQPPAAKPEPAPIIKPPQELPRKGLADIDEKTTRKKPEKPPKPVAAGSGPTNTARPAPGAAATEGFSLTAPVGPGVPGGTELFGDWYMTGVQRKIWIVWAQQMRAGMQQPAIVSFTILADGAVSDVHVVQSSGVYLLDNAAQRAILSSAPFGPLPKDYGTNRITIQGVFKPGE